MSDPFDTAVAFIWGPDRDGQQDDSAPGEGFRTSFGITEMTWNDAVNQGIVSGDFATATRDQFLTIYRVRYWNALGCDHVNPGVALVLFNDGTLTGTGHVARLLQRCVGTTEDGVVGPHTEAAANAMARADLINALIAADETYLASLANAPQFINGWTRREESCRTAALAEANQGA